MVFSTEIKIRGYHIDGHAHVNNARWVELLEEARWRWLDAHLDLKGWETIGQGVAVVSLEVNYRRPAVRHDLLVFRCWTERIGGRVAVCRQEAVRKETGERLLDARVTFVLIDIASGGPRPLAGDMLAMLEQYRHHEAPR